MLIGAASAGVLIAGYAVFVPDAPEPPPAAPTAVFESEAPSPSARPGKATGPVEGEAALEPSQPPSAAKSPAADRSQADPRGERGSGAKPSEPSGEAEPPSEPEASPPPSPAPGAEASPSSPSAITPAERASRLREESRLLSEARDALRRGDSAGALRKLEEARTRFAGGMLGQEREALTIEALYRGGQREAAAARAASFLRAYPLSPHATRVQAFTR
jgi:hypothetical protein